MSIIRSGFTELPLPHKIDFFKLNLHLQGAVMKILAIVGSPRQNGSTSYLVDQALVEAAKLGAETEKLILSKYKIEPCCK